MLVVILIGVDEFLKAFETEHVIARGNNAIFDLVFIQAQDANVFHFFF
jgi:hypothetical protein